MKKLLSLIVALMMLFTFTGALAEEEVAEDNGGAEMEPITIEVTFDGTDVAFEDGFSVMIPNEWVELEAENGKAYGTEDGEQYMIIEYTEGEYALEDLAQHVAELFGGANYVSLNDIMWVTFTSEEHDELVAAAIGNGGYYFFTFYPASDAELTDLATQIMATVRNG